MKKALKIAAGVIAVIAAVVLLYVANALLGNPVSKLLAKRAVNDYIETAYGHLDVYVSEVGYNFKDGDYYARVLSHSSIDTNFRVSIDMLGHVTGDDYETAVTSGYNTARRLHNEYRDLTRTILESPDFPYLYEFGGGSIEHVYGMAPPIPLEPDKVYNIRAIAAEYGELMVYVNDEDVSPEKAAEIVLELRRLFDEADIPFATLTFALRAPRNGDGTGPGGTIRITMHYDDISQEEVLRRAQIAY